MAIPKEYVAYLTAAVVVLVVLYAVSHMYKESAETFGIAYVGMA